MSILITPDALAQQLSRTDLRILDVRWTVMAPDGRPDYLAGHLPAAVFVDMDVELADHSVPGRGRHPLPSAANLQQAARRWGLNTGDTVVVYDDWGGQAASRAWWLLRAGGVTDVLLLDGGWAAWQRAGLATETGDVTPAPGDITITDLDAMPTTDADGVAADAAADDHVVLDARAAALYRGDEEPLDPRAGHIPGAVSAPTAAN
ncbi:MAG: rhodanese-like domain-containing protein, partial [Mycobacterium sp.]